jgi:hypothetical protein
LWSTLAAAQVPAPNQIIAPRGDIELRASPPGGLFTTAGPRVGTARAGQPLRVLQRREIAAVFGSEIWVQVAPAEGGSDGVGWMFWGRPGGTPNATIMRR